MIYFKEEQRFTQWWLWLLVISSCLVMLGLIIKKLFQPQEALSMDPDALAYHWEVLILVSVVVVIFILAYGILTAKLEVEIKDRAIYYRYKPFIWSTKKIKADDIAEFRVRQYNPIAEYGGWGYRFGFGNGKALNVKGDKGLQLKLKNGKKLLLGTQKPTEMEKVMDEMMNRKREDYG